VTNDSSRAGFPARLPRHLRERDTDISCCPRHASFPLHGVHTQFPDPSLLNTLLHIRQFRSLDTGGRSDAGRAVGSRFFVVVRFGFGVGSWLTS
jgi:hypothetical protein